MKVGDMIPVAPDATSVTLPSQAEFQKSVDDQLAAVVKKQRSRAAKFSPVTRVLYAGAQPILTQDGPFKRQDAAKARSLEIAAMSNSEKKRLGLLPKKPNKRK